MESEFQEYYYIVEDFVKVFLFNGEEYDQVLTIGYENQVGVSKIQYRDSGKKELLVMTEGWVRVYIIELGGGYVKCEYQLDSLASKLIYAESWEQGYIVYSRNKNELIEKLILGGSQVKPKQWYGKMRFRGEVEWYNDGRGENFGVIIDKKELYFYNPK